MSPLDRELRDAFRAFGEASLKLAELLSFEEPDRPEVWPGTGEPLTAARFQAMMDKVDEPCGEPKQLSYITGAALSSDARVRKRMAAMRSAASVGYDYEHWCRMVRRVRTESFKTDKRGLAIIMNVTESAVHSWEIGVCFATTSNRERLERISAGMYGVPHQSWKKPSDVGGHAGEIVVIER